MKMPRPPQTHMAEVDRYFSELTQTVTREFGKRTPDDTVRRSLFLRSPDESIWEITVDNLGALSATKVLG